jgi:hypothetical protein
LRKPLPGFLVILFAFRNAARCAAASADLAQSVNASGSS